jgi:hypothetical protein
MEIPPTFDPTDLKQGLHPALERSSIHSIDFRLDNENELISLA